MIGKRILTIIAYPISEEAKVGHLDILEELFENQKRLFEEVYVYSSNDVGEEWELKKGIYIIRPRLKLPKPLNIFYEIIYLYLRFKKNKPTIIRALSPHTTGVVAWLLSKLLRVPFVTSVHTDRKFVNKYEKNINFIYEKVADILEKKVYQDSVIIPVISHYIGDYVCSFGNFKDKLLLHRNWVDLKLFKPLKNKKYGKKIIFVGRLEKVKRVHILINSLKYLDEDIKVVIVGKGSYEKELKKIAKKFNDKVKFLGKVDHKKELPKILRNSDIFVSPVPGGFATIEAMASGLPIIGGDEEWGKEVIIKDKTGILVNAINAKKLAKAISELINNEKLIKKFGENARNFAEEEFDVKKWEKREEEIYKRVIKTHQKRRDI